MHGRDAAAVGPSPFEASASLRRLRVTGIDLWALLSLRHCERSEATQSLSAAAVWIASLRSQ